MSYIYDVTGKPFVPRSGCPKCWENRQWTTKLLLWGAILLYWLLETC